MQNISASTKYLGYFKAGLQSNPPANGAIMVPKAHAADKYENPVALLDSSVISVKKLFKTPIFPVRKPLMMRPIKAVE